MNCWKAAAVLLLLLAFIPAARAQDARWFTVSTEHFVLYTDTSETKGQKLLIDFERRFAGFEEAFGTASPRQFPIEVFLFKDHNDYLSVMPKLPLVDGVAPPEKNGYLLSGPDRLFIIAKDKSPEDISNDVGHALGHAWFEHQVMWRPFWLDEAAAEYVRKLGRNPDTKAVPEKDAFTIDDVLTIAPSDTYQDSDPGGAFRTESFRLLLMLLRENPQALRKYVAQLDREAGKEARLEVDVEALSKEFSSFVEFASPLPAVTPVVKSAAADADALTIQRGDVLLAAGKNYEAAKFYNANSPAARAARAVLTRFSRSQSEAAPALSRAAQELPDMGLVQYHFGALPIEKGKELEAQAAALQRAVQLMPQFGRAFAELARLYALTGKANQALPLLDKALQLEPEHADRIYEIRADVLLALGRHDESFRTIQTADALPHVDRKAAEAFTLKVSATRRKIESARREIDSRQVDTLRQVVEAEVQTREPVKPPTPETPVREGTISYQIAATTTLEVVGAIYPEYPESMRSLGKSGKINLRIEIAPDGSVKSAAVTSSQIPELNKDTIQAATQWTFKLAPRTRPGPVSITLSFIFELK